MDRRKAAICAFMLLKMPFRERQALMLRYGIPGPKYTLEETARLMGVTPRRIQQIEKKFVDKIWDTVGNPGTLFLEGL